MTRHAILFGLNYESTPDARLRGCINDVKNMENLLKTSDYGFGNVQVFTDISRKNRTTAQGILQEINNLAKRSWSENMDLAWIHYSGHGCSVKDKNGDENDRTDECLVPSDFKTSGVIPDDYIKDCLRNFNPKTKVICVFDCCHSGTIGDLKYRYFDQHTKQLENRGRACPANIVLFSGCKDEQTSADAYNVNRLFKYSGAMTSCMIMVLNENDALKCGTFDLLEGLRIKLADKRFSQIPQLTSSYEIKANETLF